MTQAHDQISGPVILDQVIPPGRPWSGTVRRGQVLRIVDLEGCQAVDFLCYNAGDAEERYNAADTMKISGNIFIGQGTVLYSGLTNPIAAGDARYRLARLKTLLHNTKLFSGGPAPTATAIGDDLNVVFKIIHRLMLKDILKPPD